MAPCPDARGTRQRRGASPDAISRTSVPRCISFGACLAAVTCESSAARWVVRHRRGCRPEDALPAHAQHHLGALVAFVAGDRTRRRTRRLLHAPRAGLTLWSARRRAVSASAARRSTRLAPTDEHRASGSLAEPTPRRSRFRCAAEGWRRSRYRSRGRRRCRPASVRASAPLRYPHGLSSAWNWGRSSRHRDRYDLIGRLVVTTHRRTRQRSSAFSTDALCASRSRDAYAA